MSGIFEQTPANRRRYGVAIFVGIIAGLISAFVKWGAEHPFRHVAQLIYSLLRVHNLF